MRQLVGIMGTPIDHLTVNQVIGRIDQFVQEGRFHHVATANSDFLVNSIKDSELRHILRTADLVTPDGMPVVWASQLMGSKLPERVTGADIVPRLAALAASKNYRIYMLGARPEVAQLAKKRLEADHPGIQIVGCQSPPCGSILEMDSSSIISDITKTEPDILLVALGSPKQEKWIHMYRDQLQSIPVCIGVGATFDFIAGAVKRAPTVFQRTGFEWLFRLAQEPGRLWRRYSHDLTSGAYYLTRQWIGMKSQRKSGHLEIHVAQAGECAILSPIGDLCHKELHRFSAAAETALNAGARLILDFQGVKSFDAESLGALLNLPKRASFCLQEIRIVAASPATARVLRMSGVDSELFPISDSIAQAVTDWDHDGLFWRVQSGSNSAVVTVRGAANKTTVLQLERICTEILNAGKYIDLDTRGVTYVDSNLIYAISRLSKARPAGTNVLSQSAAGFGLIPGSLMKSIIKRENMTSIFNIKSRPDVPVNAQEMSAYELEANSVLRSGAVVAQLVQSDRTPVLSVVSSS